MTKRTKRVPFGMARRKMNLDAATTIRLGKAKLVPRWINDDNHGNRLMQAAEGGYVFVTSDGSEYIGDALETPDKDRRISKLVGTHKDGKPLIAYLMAIPEKYKQEDDESKEAVNRMVDDAIRGGQPAGLQNHGVAPQMGGASVTKIDYKP